MLPVFPQGKSLSFALLAVVRASCLSALHENAGFVKIFDEQKLSVFR